MRLLITGGAGYIGAICTRRLLDGGHQVTVLDDLSTGHRLSVDPRARYVHGRVHDVARLCVGEPEAIVHFAASSSVAQSVAQPELYWANNIIGSLALLSFAREHRVPRFIFSSTAAIYGVPHDGLITEDTATMPVNPYGAAKLAVDHMLAAECVAHGITAVSFRFFNVAGAADGLGERHDPETHLVPRILDAAARGSRIEVYGDDYETDDGTCIRDYVHVCDLAAAHDLALSLELDGTHHVINLGSGRGYSVREVVAAAADVLGQPIGITLRPRRSGDPPRLVASNAKAAKILGWAPTRGLHEMIRDAHAFGRSR